MILGLSLLLAGTFVREAASQPLGTPNGKLQRWIGALGSADFDQRETAMQELTAAGGAAVPLLAAAVRGGEPEVEYRAIAVLVSIAATRPYEESARAAKAALQGIAESDEPELARRGTFALDKARRLALRGAIAYFQRLGAKLSVSSGEIESLTLPDVEVTEELIDRLKQFASSEKFVLQLPETDAAALSRLQEALPRTPILRPNGGFLGIRMGTGGDRCIVSHALPDTPAHAAGLRIGDVITRIDDHEIRNNRDLLLVVSRRRPGQRIDITIQRDGESHALEVELAKRGTQR